MLQSSLRVNARHSQAGETSSDVRVHLNILRSNEDKHRREES